MEEFTLSDAREVADSLLENLRKVIVGNEQPLRLGVFALLCQGHVLIDGVPGVGKTIFAKSIALSLGGAFKRIQCTSDLLPTDITGAYIFDQRDREFRFRPGPIMANMVLVDEVNRASPRTQSAFLEAMEERQVTVDGVTQQVPQPFLLLATRNPAEHGGTFPLPETELDRFILRLRLGYPTVEEEADIIERQMPAHPIESLTRVVTLEEMVLSQKAARTVFVDRLVTDYVVDLVNATRNSPAIHLGASPRASLSLVGLAQAHALLDGRDFTLPDDVKAVAVAALSHRLVLTAEGRAEATEEQIVEEILESTPVERAGRMQRFPFPTVRSQSG